MGYVDTEQCIVPAVTSTTDDVVPGPQVGLAQLQYIVRSPKLSACGWFGKEQRRASTRTRPGRCDYRVPPPRLIYARVLAEDIVRWGRCGKTR
nr:hypothetical protein CFP56_00228 [Quercus suber]